MDNHIIHNASDSGFSFAIIQGQKLAIAEASFLEKGIALASFQDCQVSKKLINTYKTRLKECSKAYFFNRINVPKQMGNQGIGTQLLKEVINYIDNENAFLLNHVNPYGDLDREQLIHFYTKHGMKLLHEDGLLIYYKCISLEENNTYRKITF